MNSHQVSISPVVWDNLIAANPDLQVRIASHFDQHMGWRTAALILIPVVILLLLAFVVTLVILLWQEPVLPTTDTISVEPITISPPAKSLSSPTPTDVTIVTQIEEYAPTAAASVQEDKDRVTAVISTPTPPPIAAELVEPPLPAAPVAATEPSTPTPAPAATSESVPAADPIAPSYIDPEPGTAEHYMKLTSLVGLRDQSARPPRYDELPRQHLEEIPEYDGPPYIDDIELYETNEKDPIVGVIERDVVTTTVTTTKVHIDGLPLLRSALIHV